MIECTLHSGEIILVNPNNILYCIESKLPQYGNTPLVKIRFIDESDRYVTGTLSDFKSLFI